MDWGSLGGKIAKAGASLLGTAVAGQGAGSTLGTIVGNALGVNDPTPDNISAAIDKDPEAAVKLADIQATHKAELEKVAAQKAVQLEQEQTKRVQAEVDDRKSARAMSTDDKMPQMVFTGMIVVLFAGALAALALGYFSDAADSQAGVLMVGSLITQFGATMAFWFGSNRDSQRKTAMLNGSRS